MLTQLQGPPLTLFISALDAFSLNFPAASFNFSVSVLACGKVLQLNHGRGGKKASLGRVTSAGGLFLSPPPALPGWPGHAVGLE